MRVTVNPNTDASGFDYVEAGQYRLRVVACEQKMKEGGEFPYLNWQYEFADANIVGVKGKKPGNIFDITTLKSEGNAQFMLRRVCDALGLTWGDFDTEDVKGSEFEAMIGIDKNPKTGDFQNKIAKYIPASK